MQTEFILEVTALGQVNLLSNGLNTQFSDFLPWMVFGLVAFIFTETAPNRLDSRCTRQRQDGIRPLPSNPASQVHC